MTIFGAHVPVSGWTLVALIIGGLVCVPLARLLAGRTGWHRKSTLTTLILLTATLAITLTPGEDSGFTEFHPCLSADPSDPIRGILHSGGGLGGTLLNALLLLPLTCSATLTTRRVLPTLLFALLLPTLIEPAQTLIPGRYCSVSDLVTNTGGAVLGVALGYLLLQRANRRGSDDIGPNRRSRLNPRA